MKISNYLDLSIKRRNTKEISTIFRVLHGTYRNIKQYHPIALLMKDDGSNRFDVVRVFGNNEELLNLKEHAVFNNNVNVGEVSTTPLEKVKMWYSFSKIKIPTRKNDIRSGGAKRHAKMVFLDENNIPYVDVISSGGARRMYIDIKSHNVGVDDYNPNSYGLGSSTNILPLPNF
jgi:hypothetical protein